MPDPSDAHALGGIVDNIDHAPIAHPKAPLIFVALEFLASCRPWSVPERFQLAHYTGQNVIGQRFEFPPRGGLYLDGVTIHVAGRVSRGPL